MGPDKYDETAAAMIAQLKYGSGTPFYRLEQLEAQLGIPLPAATQWEIAEEVAQLIKPARDELIRQAAQDAVVHNDDTSMRVLRLERDPSDQRTGVFTSGIVSVGEGQQDRALLHGQPACRREHRRGVEATERKTAESDSNVRRVVAQRSALACGRRNPAGQLSGAWKAAVRGCFRELPRANAVMYWRRWARSMVTMLKAGERPVAGRAAAASSGTQPAVDGWTAQMDGGSV